MPSRPPRSESHPLLIGVSAGAILFALTLCTVVMFLLPTFSTQWADATQTGPSWTPPPPTTIPLPTPIPTPTYTTSNTNDSTTTSSQATPTNAANIKAGDVVTNVNNGPVNMRRTPGYLGKPNSDRIGLVPAGQQLRVVGGPEPKDNLVWWQVQWENKTGWMAENTASGVLILKLAE